MYGVRGRIGLVVPSSNTTNEPEFRTWAPAGVSVHSARMPLEGVNEEELVGMADGVESSIEALSTADVDVVTFGCTTGSLVKGAGYDEEIESLIEASAGVPGVATSSAIRQAFDAVDATALAIATPYTDAMNDKEVTFLEDNGYEVTGITGLGIEPNLEIGRQDPSVAYRLGRRIDHPDADAVFISCTNFRTLEVIADLERDLGKPVISSNSATLWSTLGRVGVAVDDVDLGRLYSITPPRDAGEDR